jgi:hypothetical protein
LGHRFSGEGTDEEVEIETNGCVVTVRKNEVLTGEDVTDSIVGVCAGRGKPKQYVWRDMTPGLIENKPEEAPA